MNHKSKKFTMMNRPRSRRDLLKLVGKTFGGIYGSHFLSHYAYGQQQRKYLFVVAASGGGALLDSFLPQTTGPNAYANDQIVQPAGSNLRAVVPLENSIQGAIALGNGFPLANFLTKHAEDTCIVTSEVSSVNHIIAAQRAVTGDHINGGISIAEANSAKYGLDLPLPNLSMAGDGYGMKSFHPDLPRKTIGIDIADPLMFAFATHGFAGIRGAPLGQQMRLLRVFRRELEGMSKFSHNYGNQEVVKTYLENRQNLARSLEDGDSITKMMLLNSPNLGQFQLQLSPSYAQVLEKFPNLANDPLESKMALGFLAMKYGMATTATIEPSNSPLITPEGTPNAPINFDWSHVDHRGGQNASWSYIMRSVDALIDLLKSEDIEGDPSKGKMWSQSFIYIATEFGRDKVSSGSSGHHLNNGNLLISPLLKGNRIYGGVDPQTSLTFGFDPLTGEPDPNRNMKEKDIYSLIAQALGIEFDKRTDMSGLVRV